jgi:hypothetical protein
MRYWETLIRLEDRGGFEVIVDKSWEDCHPNELFDDTVYDIRDICRKIDSGELDWFMLRARALLNGHELGSDIVGGFLYEDARETLEDGTAEDLIERAVIAAREEAQRLLGSLQRVVDKEPA